MNKPEATMLEASASAQALADAAGAAMYARDRASQALGMTLAEIRPGYARMTITVREDKAAVAGLVAVQHVLAHRHGHARVAGTDLGQRHAQRLRSAVARVHGGAGGFGQRLRLCRYRHRSFRIIHGSGFRWRACGATAATRDNGPRHTSMRDWPAR